MKQKLITAEEQDVVSKYWKYYLHWKPRERKRIKKGLNRRLRRKDKQNLRDTLLEKWYGENEDE